MYEKLSPLDKLAAARLAARKKYPYFTGAADERGAWDGEGLNRNLPMPWGTGFDVWSDALTDACR